MAWVARLVGPVSVRGRVSRLTQLVSKTLATTTTGTRYGPHVVEATTATAARGTAAGTPCCHMQPPLLQHRTVATSSAAAHAAATVEPSDDVGEVVMSEDVFHDIAGKTLDDLEMALEDLVDGITADDADLSYSNGVLTLTLGGEHGTYVFNKQTPNRQLWWSSPLSGPKRFEYNAANNTWTDVREGMELVTMLAEELRHLGFEFEV